MKKSRFYRFVLTSQFLFCFSVIPLAAQEADSRLVGRLSTYAIDSVTALVRRAIIHDLPVEPLIQKALEGQSKRAADVLILRAVEDLLSRLEGAARVLDEDASDSELVAAAGALYLGVSIETLRNVASTHAGASVAVPLIVLTDIIREGVTTETASDIILQLVEARVDVEGLQRFRRLVERDIDLGAAPAEAAMIRVRGALLDRRRGVNQPSSA